VPVVSAQEFNRDLSAAKRAAAEGPVFVTNRGKTTPVLLTIADYRARAGGRSLFDALHPPWLDEAGAEGLEYPVRDELPRAAEL
jgi:hypothetical protein